MPEFHPETPPTHVWSQIRKLDVLPQIKSIQDYERSFVFGFLAANDYLAQAEGPIFTLANCLATHWLLFREIHPWAGKLRRFGEVVIVAGRVGADPPRIPVELKLWTAQCELFHADLRSQDWTAAQCVALRAAFAHLRLVRVHPFRDGNGRLARLLLAAEVRRYFPGVEFDWLASRSSYLPSLHSGDQGDLAPSRT